MDFLENMGVGFIVVLCFIAFISAMLFVHDIGYNKYCELHGYATEIYLRGESYCVAFKDGILKSVGTLRKDDGDFIIEREFVLVEHE